MTYNKSDSLIYRAASRIRAQATHLIQELQQTVQHIPTDSPENGRVGDLESSFSVLNLLLSSEGIKDDLNVILDKDPLSSLFAFELEKLKPPPPPPPPPPPKPPRDRKAEAERRRQKLLENGGGLSAANQVIRTRRAHAKAEAFEAEANATGAGSSPNSLDVDIDADSTDGRSSKGGKRKKKPPVVMPGQADVPPVVDDVDKQDSFKMFDEGWILPSGTRRGGRAPPEKMDQPPPRKKQKTGKFINLFFFSCKYPESHVADERQRSTLSIYSTPASENQTLLEIETTPPRTPHEEVEKQEEPSSDIPEVQHKVEESEHVEIPPAADDSMEQVTQDEIEISPDSKRPGKERRPPTVIIEELDTPAIRREKNMARKRRKAELEKQKQDEAAAAAAVTTLALSQLGLGEDVSDLSSLSSVTNEDDRMADFKNDGDDDESDYEEGDTSITVVSAADARKAAQRAGLGPATLRVRENELLEGGTLGAYIYFRSPLSPRMGTSH